MAKRQTAPNGIRRRPLTEAQKTTLSGLAVGQIRTGRVKSVVAFGVFIDLGGIDGLLHISEIPRRLREGPHSLRAHQTLSVGVRAIEGERISLTRLDIEREVVTRPAITGLLRQNASRYFVEDAESGDSRPALPIDTLNPRGLVDVALPWSLAEPSARLPLAYTPPASAAIAAAASTPRPAPKPASRLIEPPKRPNQPTKPGSGSLWERAGWWTGGE